MVDQAPALKINSRVQVHTVKGTKLFLPFKHR